VSRQVVQAYEDLGGDDITVDVAGLP